MISLRKLLSREPLAASAPCRVDAGGTWDIKSMALPLERTGPVTVNIAVTLRTVVSLTAFDDGWVRITSEGFHRSETCSACSCPFDSNFGLSFAAVSHFGFHGLEVSIRSQSPVKSALGGSSTALVALVKALADAAARLGVKPPNRRGILHLGYHLEDGISGGFCGLQDQAAAVYGGVNLWEWRYGDPVSPLRRTPLLDRRGREALSERLLVAYSGKSHASLPINRRWIRSFLSGQTRSAWTKINEGVRRFAEALRERQWDLAGGLLAEETALRREITPEALTPLMERLTDQAAQAGCGARFAGAGAGGSLWALGDAPAIKNLRALWKETLKPVKGAGLLDCRVDPEGVRAVSPGNAAVGEPPDRPKKSHHDLGIRPLHP